MRSHIARHSRKQREEVNSESEGSRVMKSRRWLNWTREGAGQWKEGTASKETQHGRQTHADDSGVGKTEQRPPFTLIVVETEWYTDEPAPK